MTEQEDRYDVKQLPEWAQEHIRALEEGVLSLRREIRDLTGGEQETRVRAVSLGRQIVYLPNDVMVSFDQGRGAQQRLDVFAGDPGVVVRSTWGKIRIRPEAANVLRIELE